MVPPTPNSSARCRVWNMTPLNAVMLEFGKVYHGVANPRLFRSLSEFMLCFPRHSEAEWMLRTDLAYQRQKHVYCVWRICAVACGCAQSLSVCIACSLHVYAFICM